MGVGEANDGIVRYVTDIVRPIPWADLWRPIFDPPPMNTMTYRPLTALSVKVLMALTGEDVFWMAVLHAPCLVWLAFAVRRALVAFGMERVAWRAAASTVVLPSLLFSTWIPVESDVMGAAFVCEAAALLPRVLDGATGRSRLLLVLWLLGAATTKETSAAAGGLLVGAFALTAPRGQRLAAWSWVGGYAVVLGICITPLLLSKGLTPHDFHVDAEGFSWSRAGYLGLHNLAQVFYVTSSAGAVALLVLALAHGHERRPRLVRWLGALAVAALFLAPPLRVYNHYESVIIDHIDFVGPSTGVAVLALAVLALAGPRHQRVAALIALGLLATLVLAPVLARQSRPDVSARLYAPVIPFLHALAWRGVDRAREQLPRAASRALWVCFALFPLFNAVNGVGAWRARMSTESVAKPELAALITRDGVSCPIVIATNRNHELAIEELKALGVPWPACAELFVPNRMPLDSSDADLSTWRAQGYLYSLGESQAPKVLEALIEKRVPERCVVLYEQSAKTTLETFGRFVEFSGDFAWAFDKLPEFNREMHQQQLELQFRENTSYEALFRRVGAPRRLVAAPYVLLPINPNEVVGRLLRGMPLVETYQYEIRLMPLDGCLQGAARP